MNDEIGKITEEKQDYQEYVESFAHEIKIPIGALSLTFDNTKNYTLKKETDKIFQLVEQMLYYARSENTEKDYFVKQLQLDEVIHNVILKFRHSLMERKVIINIHDIENVVYVCEMASHGDCTPRPFQKKASDPRSDPRATVGKVVLPRPILTE